MPDKNKKAAGYTTGFRDGIPIGLGYLSVSFTFGMMAVTSGIPIIAAVVISMTNLTSAGQFAGLTLIMSGAPYIEMVLTQFIINLRYALMSLSLSQKLDSTVKTLDRLIISFANTDEIFAVASSRKGEVGRRYLYGLATAPYFGWSLGTLIGAVAGSFLPPTLRSALGIAIYGMFLAIIIPPAKKSKAVLLAVAMSSGMSCLFRYLPFLKKISSGFVIIICTIVSATFCALIFPPKEDENEEGEGTE